MKKTIVPMLCLMVLTLVIGGYALYKNQINYEESIEQLVEDCKKDQLMLYNSLSIGITDETIQKELLEELDYYLEECESYGL